MSVRGYVHVRRGEKHNRLTAIRFAGDKRWEWQCDCGTVKAIKASEVRSGNTKSCGCIKREALVANRRAARASQALKRPISREVQVKALPVLFPTAVHVARQVARSKLCEGLPVREFKPLLGHQTQLERHRAMCEATR
jgi:hypothetical protein